MLGATGVQAGTQTTEPGLGGHVVISLPLKQQISPTIICFGIKINNAPLPWQTRQ